MLKESEGPSFSILLTITPHAMVESTAWVWMAMNYGQDIPEPDLIAWQELRQALETRRQQRTQRRRFRRDPVSYLAKLEADLLQLILPP